MLHFLSRSQGLVLFFSRGGWWFTGSSEGQKSSLETQFSQFFTILGFRGFWAPFRESRELARKCRKFTFLVLESPQLGRRSTDSCPDLSPVRPKPVTGLATWRTQICRLGGLENPVLGVLWKLQEGPEKCLWRGSQFARGILLLTIFGEKEG